MKQSVGSIARILLLLSVLSRAVALNPSSSSRRAFLRDIGTASLLTTTVGFGPTPSLAAEDKIALTDEQIKEVVKQDVIDRQFLATGNLTPSIYRPTATFTDEIDTYKMDQWVKGTQRLFVGEKSSVRLIGDIDVSPQKIEFRFDEDLMFRIPLRPTVSLSGKVVLERDEAGYITSYREFWDQDTWTVLKTAKF